MADEERRRSLRELFEQDRDAPYTDAEWAEAEENLLKFFALLAEWDAKDKRERK